ncbi:MAG: response regulator transcription factor [Woeseiaceae bacterium]|nr:response regulator transcription factor [Woeseiaceae bacterium]
MSAPSILVVDDDTELCGMVVRYLSGDGFIVDKAHNGRDGLQAIGNQHYDLVILDVMMPEMSGQDVLHRLRTDSSLGSSPPVLMLTARGDEVDRIIGLETGADDYLAKPCSLRELAARIRAILRRTNGDSEVAAENGFISVGSIVVDLNNRTAEFDGQPLGLTGAEYSVLLCLARADGRPVSKESLTRVALGRDFHPHDRSIDMHIANLRKKMAQAGAENTQVRTLRGKGYWLVIAADS